MQTTSGEQNLGHYVRKIASGFTYYTREAMNLAGADPIRLKEVSAAYEAGRRKVAIVYAQHLSDIKQDSTDFRQF